MDNDIRQITVPAFHGHEGRRPEITVLTAYDYAMASVLDGTGIEGILVGDSLSMVVQGHRIPCPSRWRK